MSIHFQVMDGAAERLEAWHKGEDEYAAVLRRQFMPNGAPRCSACAHQWHARATDERPWQTCVEDGCQCSGSL